ncbi:MAG: PspC domain-containing protein [Clostridia bacterium]|nr:PspC domain-containing protein [Clostridia bacterium]MBC7346140.1 PspC domain-containing protein [Clostridia bacterium]
MARRLFRSRAQRILGGVCGGFAEYFDVDVVLVRLLWALSVLLNGAGLRATLPQSICS